MLRGRIGNTSGEPLLEGLLQIPSQNISNHISFLVDTGADMSILMPDDGVLMGIDYSALSDTQVVGGIGGETTIYTEPARIIFAESGKCLHAYAITLGISPVKKELEETHSLIGRDILQNWKMRYHPTTGYVAFDVIRSDLEISLS